MSSENLYTPSDRPYSRRHVLIRASHGGIALGALSALPDTSVEARDAGQADGQATPPTSANVTDFERSYLRFRIDTTKMAPKTVSRKLPMTLNNVRFNLDARAIITHKITGRVHDYVLTASCKSEQVWVQRDIWHQPNADMCMLAGGDEFLVLKRWDKTDKGVMLHPPSLGVQPERQWDKPTECFDQFSIDLATRSARELDNMDSILATLSGNSPVVARTEYEAANHRVVLEYPVKVVNFSERERYYQVDTGPILLPEFDREYRSLLESCRLAYIGHNCREWAEVIVCVPTPLTDTIKVHHYSESIRLDKVCNRLFAVT